MKKGVRASALRGDRRFGRERSGALRGAAPLQEAPAALKARPGARGSEKQDTRATEHGLVWTQEQATGPNARGVSLELRIHASVEAVRLSLHRKDRTRASTKVRT